MRYPLLAAAAVSVFVAGSGRSAAQTMRAPPPMPMSRLRFEQLKLQPALLDRLTHPAPVAMAALAPRPPGGPWRLATAAPFSAGAMLLLTDGTVMVQDMATPENGGGSAWWRLSPDAFGSYVTGHWSRLASMQAGYTPLYYASAVLPDGRVIVEGGEYNGGDAVWSGQGSIYDPVADAWTPVAPPAGMNLAQSSIGDAQGIVLANGKFMLSPVYAPPSGNQQILDPATLTWTGSGQNKATDNDEEGGALLPSGKVLAVDVNPAIPLSSELYDPLTGKWTQAGSTKVLIWDSNHEVGPTPTMPNGDVFAVGSTLGHNAVFHVDHWTAAPDFPVIGGAQFGTPDGPAATLPSGKILVLASAGYGAAPSHFFMFDGTTLTRAADTPNCRIMTSYDGYMLVLPTGQALFNDRRGSFEVYTDAGAPSPAWIPRITSVPPWLRLGKTYQLAGSQLNGRTSGASYGDDYQSATNYPLVRLTNDATHHVFYARTGNFSTMSIQANKASTTSFTVPPGIEVGPTHLVVVANGLASVAAAVTLLR